MNLSAWITEYNKKKTFHHISEWGSLTGIHFKQQQWNGSMHPLGRQAINHIDFHLKLCIIWQPAYLSSGADIYSDHPWHIYVQLFSCLSSFQEQCWTQPLSDVILDSSYPELDSVCCLVQQRPFFPGRGQYPQSCSQCTKSGTMTSQWQFLLFITAQFLQTSLWLKLALHGESLGW